MLSKEFLDGKHSYRIHKDDMPRFLEECDHSGLEWWFRKHERACTFDPFVFYKGMSRRWLFPVMRIDDPFYVYVKCLNGILYWSYHYDWEMQPFKEYSPDA